MRICPVGMNDQRVSKTPNFEAAKISSKLVKNTKNIVLPTMVALAMLVPSQNLNAQKVQKNFDETEYVSKRNKNADLPYYLQNDAIQYSKKFEMDGKKYTMYYTDYCQKYTDRKNSVLEIFFVPEDFKLYKDGQSELNSPPKLEELIYHELDGEGENFVSAVISESVCEEDGNNYQQIFREIVLPEKIGEKLLKLYQGKSKYYLLPGVDTYSESSSKEMMQPIIMRGKTLLKLDK